MDRAEVEAILATVDEDDPRPKTPREIEAILADEAYQRERRMAAYHANRDRLIWGE